jgi:adenine-specific DNA glycosylase
MILAGDIRQFHVLMIGHGRRRCHARRPDCRACILSELCPSSTAGPATSTLLWPDRSSPYFPPPPKT